MMVRGLLLCAAALSAGCAIAVTAQGRVAPGPDGRAWISASNGKTYPLAPTGLGEPLRYLDGDLVQLDGRLVRKTVEVEHWAIVEGKLGFSAFTGVVTETTTGFAIRDPQSGQVIALSGKQASAARPHVGRMVLVEGVIDGPMTVRALRVAPLYGPPQP